jgi:hypothetical protein
MADPAGIALRVQLFQRRGRMQRGFAHQNQITIRGLTADEPAAGNAVASWDVAVVIARSGAKIDDQLARILTA